jgi:hypothetical protein
MLPKYKKTKERNLLCCRICKCFVPAKATLTNETCLLGKWERNHATS